MASTGPQGGGLARKAWREKVERSSHRSRTLKMPATWTRPRVGVGTDDSRWMPKPPTLPRDGAGLTLQWFSFRAPIKMIRVFCPGI